MTHKSLFNAVGLTVIIGVAAATTVLAADSSKLPPPSKQTGVTYDKDIKPIFQASCFGCHGENRQSGRLRLDSLDAALKGGSGGKVIEVGNSADSTLALAVCWDTNPDHKMPPPPRGPRRGMGGTNTPAGTNTPPPGPGGPGGPGARGPAAKPLTTEQVALIRAWIDQGAK